MLEPNQNGFRRGCSCGDNLGNILRQYEQECQNIIIGRSLETRLSLELSLLRLILQQVKIFRQELHYTFWKCFYRAQMQAKFLGVILNVQLNFDNQCNVVRDRTVKTNAMLKYVNRICRNVEVPALLFYKRLVRYILDY